MQNQSSSLAPFLTKFHFVQSRRKLIKRGFLLSCLTKSKGKPSENTSAGENEAPHLSL